MLGMITTAAHKRIVAEKDAEIAGLMRRLIAAEEIGNINTLNVEMKLRLSERRYNALEARLAPFTTPRPRNAKGQFMKDAA